MRSRLGVLSLLAICLVACEGGIGGGSADGAGGGSGSGSGASSLMYSCGGARFSIERLESPIPDEEIPQDAWDALDKEAARLQPDLGLTGRDDWGAVRYSRSQVTFLTEKPSRRFPYSSFTLERARGDWSFAGAGDCRPSAVARDGKDAAEWRVVVEPGESDDELRLSASEMNCSSGRKLAPEDFEPRVVYEPDRILIALLTEPPEGAQTCIGNPWTRLTLELDEPVGDRDIYDAGFYPFRRR
ncbi:MAG: hypothetical protein ABR613_11455 [Actinomycetota bacterium]